MYRKSINILILLIVSTVNNPYKTHMYKYLPTKLYEPGYISFLENINCLLNDNSTYIKNQKTLIKVA